MTIQQQPIDESKLRVNARQIDFRDLGMVDYKKAWDYQEELFQKILRYKASLKTTETMSEIPPNHLLFCEHPHVFTLGKSGDPTNLLITESLLKQKGASYYKINRGGDITYHGPGQIVGYPILDLERFGLGIKEYIFKLEESIIKTLRQYQLPTSRMEAATGVWLDAENQIKARKICAIGVRASRFVTMHGFAFNVNTDLQYYKLINPCGFIDKGVTSLEMELGRKVNFKEVQGVLLKNFSEVFDAEIILS